MLRRPAALCVDRLPNELRGATQNCTTPPIVSAVSASIYLQAHSLPRRLTQMPSSHKRGPTAGMVRVTRHCSRCQNPRVAAAYPARQLGSAAKPEMDPIAAACDLVGAARSRRRHQRKPRAATHLSSPRRRCGERARPKRTNQRPARVAAAAGAPGRNRCDRGGRTPPKSAQTDDWKRSWLSTAAACS
jgi:hypothetical protein